MMRRIAALLWILVAVAGCADAPPDRAMLAQSLDRAEAAFSQMQVQGDIGFWVGQAAMLAGRSPRLTLMDDVQFGSHDGLKRYDFYLWSLRNRPVAQIAGTRVQRGAHGYQRGFLANPADTTVAERVDLAFRLMTDAIDCSPGQPLMAAGMTPDYGYVSTHQLMALLIAVERRCLEATQLPALAAPFINRLVDEMLDWRGELADVQVERAALLALIGRFDLVPQTMVATLLKTQYGDGLWVFGQMELASLNTATHNTALAYVVMATAFANSAP